MHYCDACEQAAWHLELWKKGEPSSLRRVPYRCRSWRHAGECRQWKGSQDFARIAEALSWETEWVYVVLTFSQRDWTSVFQQYKSGVLCWSKLRKRFTRKYGMMKYIQTWERFRKGGVHVNVMIWNEQVYNEVLSDFRAFRNDFLTPHAVQCGFGKRTWVEAMRGDTRAMAGYLSKLATELTGQGKDYQIPVDAPKNFRRIRASNHTLPPANKTDLMGRLRMFPVDGMEMPNGYDDEPELKTSNERATQ